MIDEKRLIRECEERLLVGTNVIKTVSYTHLTLPTNSLV